MSEDEKKIKILVPGDPLEEGEDEPSLLCWVTDEIAIGTYAQAAYVELMTREGIGTVISIGNLRPYYPREMGVEHSSFVNIEDCTDTFSDYEIRRVVTAIIEGTERGKTFVHCAAGVSRSPGFTTAVLCHRDGLDWDEALAIVKAGRPQAKVHHLIEKRLRKWLADQHPEE